MRLQQRRLRCLCEWSSDRNTFEIHFLLVFSWNPIHHSAESKGGDEGDATDSDTESDDGDPEVRAAERMDSVLKIVCWAMMMHE